MVLHPQHQHASSYVQNPSQYQVEPYQQPYQSPQQQLQPPQQPPYSRHDSHRSYHSHHSSNSHHPHHPDRRDEHEDRYQERRPTLGDTLNLIWRTAVGALTWQRR